MAEQTKHDNAAVFSDMDVADRCIATMQYDGALWTIGHCRGNGLIDWAQGIDLSVARGLCSALADGLGVAPAEVDEMLSAAELRDYTRRARVDSHDGAVLTIAAEDWCQAQEITPSAWLQLPGLDDAGHVHLSDRAAKRLTQTVIGRREQGLA